MRKPLTVLALIALTGAPALAQTDPPGSLPPPFEPQPRTTESAREPGFGERAGATADRAASGVVSGAGRAARATGNAIGRAARWTGDRLERAGEWTRERAERIGE